MTGAAADVLILGGGPAGAAAARLLALWGHRVSLVTKPPQSAPDLPESIPPSTRKLFDVLGVTAAVDDAGFIRTTGNTVWWGREARVESFADGARGWQVTSAALSAVLLDAATEAGAHVTYGAIAPDAVAGSPARFTLDCTGRAGLIARAEGLRVMDAEHRTVAMVGRWRAPDLVDIAEPTHTIIESYPDGWAWSVPLSTGDRAVAVMVDPARSNLARDRTAHEVYALEIQKTTRFGPLLAAATLVDGPDGWDASMYGSRRYVAGNRLLVGDAASFIDPLSSAGVKKALASAWLAAVAVHTCLSRPVMRDTALDFFAAREAEMYASFRQLTLRHLAGAASAYDQPFWSDRVDERRTAPIDRDAIAAAFDQLRERNTLQVRRGRAVQVMDRPAVSGREIVMEPRLVAPGDAAGTRYVSEVDVLVLVELAPDAPTVPDLFTAYNRRAAPVGLPEFLTALSTALARGLLEWADQAAAP